MANPKPGRPRAKAQSRRTGHDGASFVAWRNFEGRAITACQEPSLHFPGIVLSTTLQGTCFHKSAAVNFGIRIILRALWDSLKGAPGRGGSRSPTSGPGPAQAATIITHIPNV